MRRGTRCTANIARALCLALAFGVAAGAPKADTPTDDADCGTSWAKAWIERAFAGADRRTGQFTKRVALETPVLVHDATLSGPRVGFSVWHGGDPQDRRAAFRNVTISDLRSSDIYGAGIKTNRKDGGIRLFLADVTIRPGWPAWESYATTNYDAIVLDGAAAFHAQSLRIADWNADSAIDNKADVSQIVDLAISGPGHRPLRYWTPGPHYLVGARIDKPGGGTLIWFDDCSTVSLHIYDSLFNGVPRLRPDQISCATGNAPAILYPARDPRTTGDMHPMFRACAAGD